MSTRSAKPQWQSQPLCDYCHQKPKFGAHGYCSKTCASQAGSGATNPALCIQCNQKPKFQGFDFCGKSCAAAAPQRRNTTGTTAANSKGGNPPNKQQQPAINAMKVAQFVAQQVPTVKAVLAALNGTAGAAPHQQVQQMVPSTAPQNNPFLQAQQAPAALGAMNGSTPAVSSSLLFATQPQIASGVQPADDDDDTECLVPGCGKPVHVDSKGLKTSDYCSQRHREEAVSSGLVDPCIMCLEMPQTQKDYFCSRTCREEAMMKLPE